MNIFVSGGSRGIGEAIVRLFCGNGHRVAFAYNSSIERADALARECSAIPIQANFYDSYSVVEVAEKAALELGHVDVLINNAGIAHFSLLTDTSEQDWDRVFAINMKSAYLLSKALLPPMIQRKFGRIINISSMWGLIGSSCEVAYSASKAAMIGFTKALAKEVGPSGITVNAIAPGLIDTDMNRTLSYADIASIVDETPLSRIGEPIDIANIAYFLASDSASFITGAVLNASGGLVT